MFNYSSHIVTAKSESLLEILFIAVIYMVFSRLSIALIGMTAHVVSASRSKSRRRQQWQPKWSSGTV